MSLSKERTGEIALAILLQHYEQKGLKLRPTEVRRDVKNRAKSLGIDWMELREFTMTVIEHLVARTVTQLGLDKLEIS